MGMAMLICKEGEGKNKKSALISFLGFIYSVGFVSHGQGMVQGFLG